MRKYLLITLCSVVAYNAFGQSRAGLRLAPNLSMTRVEAQSDTLRITSAGAGARIMFGPILDFPLGLTDNYFTTGLLYAPQRVALDIRKPEGGDRFKEVYNLQYLQIPGLFTFLTDEIALDKRLYFEVGGLFGIKIHEIPKHPDHFFIQKFNLFNLTASLGAGVEMAMGTSTVMALGIGYYRALGNVVDRQIASDTNITIKNHQLSLDFSVRF